MVQKKTLNPIKIIKLINGDDIVCALPAEGATHYHTTEVSPGWRYTMRVTVQIGQHIFYKP